MTKISKYITTHKTNEDKESIIKNEKRMIQIYILDVQ